MMLTSRKNELLGLAVVAVWAVFIAYACFLLHRFTTMIPIINMLLFGEKLRKNKKDE